MKKENHMFIILTHFENGSSILVNPDSIRAVDASPDGVSTRIVFSEDHAYLVKEPLDEVLNLVNACRGK